jgi:hypothetical protein
MNRLSGIHSALWFNITAIRCDKVRKPIDSRITGWLNEFGFPITLSADALSDRNYYRFISEGVRELCDACHIYPCLLDAAIFSSYDREATFRLSS